MIFVDRTTVAVPSVLDGPDSKGGKERVKAEAFYGASDNEGQNYAFKVYREQEVKDRLEELFHRKCAYCESSYAGTQPMDVEHYRPKGGYVTEVDGKRVLQKPGYWWLAAEWSNLLPSCIDCNRSRTHRFEEDGEEVARRLGKENRFPLRKGAKRLACPTDDFDEGALLLDPCHDDPAEFLLFTLEGVVKPHPDLTPEQRERAQASIEVYGLQRPGLVTARSTERKELEDKYRHAQRILGRWLDQPDHPYHRGDLAAALAPLCEKSRAECLYTLMARQLVDHFLEELRPVLGGYLQRSEIPVANGEDPIARFIDEYLDTSVIPIEELLARAKGFAD